MADQKEKSTKEDLPKIEEASPDKGKKKKKKEKIKKKKEKRQFSLGLQSLPVKILIGAVIVLLEVGVCYTLITKLLLTDNTEGTNEPLDPGESEVVEVSSDKQKDRSIPVRRVVETSSDSHVTIEGFYRVDDLVVNPAFSQGKKFLIISLVVAVELEEMKEILTERDPIIKDRIIMLLSQKESAWLASVTNREILRSEIIAIVEDVIRYSGGMHVYFTKFVLQ